MTSETLAPECPTPRRVTTYLVDGLHGISRVISLFHSRRYRVINLSVQVRDGVVESSIDCTVLLCAGELDVLLERLRRIPSVVTSYPT